MSRIDVIVPCHNYGRFLAECVESVTSQSHRELRVLIIDDASTDDTAVIGEELAAADPRVTFLRHAAGHGHISTYNQGLDWADGDYFLVLSADDFVLPGAFERALRILDARRQVGLLYAAFVEYRVPDQQPYRVKRPWHPGPVAISKTMPEQLPKPSSTNSVQPAELIRSWGVIGNHVGMSTAITRTVVQKRLGGYRKDLPHSGDLEMWLRFALHSKVVYLDQLQAVYRRHGQNMSIGYAGLPNVQQCVEAFRPHYREISRRVPGGAALVGEIQASLEAKAAKLGGSIAPEPRLERLSRLFGFGRHYRPQRKSG